MPNCTWKVFTDYEFSKFYYWRYSFYPLSYTHRLATIWPMSPNPLIWPCLLAPIWPLPWPLPIWPVPLATIWPPTPWPPSGHTHFWPLAVMFISMLISISPHVGSIHVKIIFFSSCEKTTKIVMKQPRFHQKVPRVTNKVAKIKKMRKWDWLSDIQCMIKWSKFEVTPIRYSDFSTFWHKSVKCRTVLKQAILDMHFSK